eukprot:5377448-Pleurochrysis_carterae.AAC.1
MGDRVRVAAKASADARERSALAHLNRVSLLNEWDQLETTEGEELTAVSREAQAALALAKSS